MNLDHPNEPPVRIDIDVQDTWRPDAAWSGSITTEKEILRNPGKGARIRLRQIVWRGYNNLGCGALTCVLISAIAGTLIIDYFVGALMIIMEFGPDSYFKQHLRFVPHRGIHLTNGGSLGVQYQILSVVLCSIGLILWISVTLVTVMGIDYLVGVIRCHRARKTGH
jgi:hypothetical protein